MYCCEGMFTAPLPSNRILLLRGSDHIENASTLLLIACVCWALHRADWKNVFTLHIPPLSSTHLWLRCSNFFNPSKKNYFACSANRKWEMTKTYQHPYVHFVKWDGRNTMNCRKIRIWNQRVVTNLKLLSRHLYKIHWNLSRIGGTAAEVRTKYNPEHYRRIIAPYFDTEVTAD
jgi:hypothetical protein